jgi:hypothetical protein
MVSYALCRRSRISSILLVFLLAACLFLFPEISRAQIDNGSLDGMPLTVAAGNASDHASLASDMDITNTGAEPSLNLKYIWSISGIEKDQVIMALNQNGKALYGQAKYESDNDEPWNGVVAGFVSGNRVYLAMATMKNKEKVSIVLEGIVADEAIRGEFLQGSGGKSSRSGNFSAIWINPDLSSYTPAVIEESGLVPTGNSTVPGRTNVASSQAAQDSRFHDVRQDANRILTGVGDISQIPIGMSGL